MRTLEEVIYAYEQCASEDLEEGCGHCAYKDVLHGRCKLERNDDALQYLKNLKKIVDIPEGGSGEITITIRKESREQTYEQFLEDMKVLGYDKVRCKEN